MESISYSLWAIIVCLFYVAVYQLLYFRAEKGERAKIKDLKYFSYAILLFFLAAVVNLVFQLIFGEAFGKDISYNCGLEAPYCHPVSSSVELVCPCVGGYSYFYFGLKTLISAANNIFLILTLPFIQLFGQATPTQQKLIDYIKERIVLFFFVFIEVGYLVAAYFIFYNHHLSPIWILAIDSWISILVIALLAWFLNSAFKSRGFPYFQFLSWITFALMFITQVNQFFPTDLISPQVDGAISAAYKTLLMGLFLILLYTYRKKQINDLYVELAEKDQQLVQLQREEKLTNKASNGKTSLTHHLPAEEMQLHFSISSNAIQGLIAHVTLQIAGMAPIVVDFSNSETTFIVLLKFAHKKHQNEGPMKVKRKEEMAAYDCIYQDLSRISQKFMGEENWASKLLQDSLKDSLFNKVQENHYQLTLPQDHIHIDCNPELLKQLLLRTRQ